MNVTTGIDPYHTLVVCTLTHYAGRVNSSSICYFDDILVLIYLYEFVSIFYFVLCLLYSVLRMYENCLISTAVISDLLVKRLRGC